ncbi:chromate efflux transporter [Loktanella sp. F6476L]|uniref:chromate efflux transporter n=1 Tax=Loktanella sp. F6476L TaxID=2926405 RepID=UPI001FF6D881|nr:chromate efflux transporter [Loktanella sp. F6476L]MCK0121474.1 chromate efflux transporter [Loktanella sp. F6476L]
MTPSYADLTRVFGRIGLLSFGGPAAQIALMHKSLVEDRDWLTEDQFLRALSFCMLLPGPEAMQLATYAGWRKRGILGGLIGGGLFVLPGAIVIMALALLYGSYGSLPLVQAIFLGVKATVVVIVIEALIKVSKRALVSRTALWLAAFAFVALFFFALPFPIVIVFAAVVGAMTAAADTVAAPSTKFPWAKSFAVVVIGCLLWAAPFALIGNADPILAEIGAFFAWLAVVTFGGAYAVLAYMTQAVVGDFGWLTTPQMMDALGLAETTPGPLILVTQFVGMIAGAQAGGTGLALIAGVLTLWVTFVPCFIWIFAGAPLIDWLEQQPRLKAALAGITAAVVGVIANLSVWFALHVFFGSVTPFTAGPITSVWPDLTTVQPLAIALSGLAGVLLLWRHINLLWVLFICAAISGTLAMF